jgi:hypothetical protein
MYTEVMKLLIYYNNCMYICSRSSVFYYLLSFRRIVIALCIKLLTSNEDKQRNRRILVNDYKIAGNFGFVRLPESEERKKIDGRNYYIYNTRIQRV